MSKPNKVPFVIFSVYRSNEKPFFNQACHATVCNALRNKGIPFKELVGVYIHKDGTMVCEQSILVNENYHTIALKYALKYNQESILRVGADRSAYLEYVMQISEEYQGQFKEVREDEAIQKGSFTYDLENKSFWACV